MDFVAEVRSHTRLGIVHLLCLAALVACGDPVAPSRQPPPSSGRHVYAPEDFSWESDTASSEFVDFSSAEDPSLPQWNGDPAFTTEPDLAVCPAEVPNPTIQAAVREPSGDYHATFRLSGTATLIRVSGARHGFPTGVYTFPGGNHMDISGRYYIYNGQYLMGECHTIQAWVPGMGTITLGTILWYDYVADISYLYGGLPVANQNLASGGWAFYSRDGINGIVQAGVHQGWEQALDMFIQNGACMDGWVVIVDGKKACDAYGHRVG